MLRIYLINSIAYDGYNRSLDPQLRPNPKPNSTRNPEASTKLPPRNRGAVGKVAEDIGSCFLLHGLEVWGLRSRVQECSSFAGVEGFV